jgi:L-aminopeptidase/D-esterase-like protein
VTIAALAVVNASGSPFDPRTAAPWSPPRRLRRPTADERAAWQAAVAPVEAPPLNTTIGVVATDADLSRPEAGRLAQSAHDGLARALRPAHGLFDGDTIFGLATGDRSLPTPGDPAIVRGVVSRAAALNQIFVAAADVFATACTDAVLAATTVGATLAYRDLCPSVFGGAG